MGIVIQVKDLVEQGKYDDALLLINHYDQNDLETWGHLLVFKVRIHRHIGEFDLALSIAKEIHGYNKDLKNKLIEVRTIIEEAYIYWNMSRFEQTTKLIEKGRTIYKPEDQDIASVEIEISTMDNLQGLVNLYAGDLNEALRYFTSGLEIRKRIGQKHLTAISLNNIGVCYHRKGEPDKSKKYFLESEMIFRELNNSTDIGLPYSNLALVYYELGMLTESLEYFKKSEQIEVELGNSINIAETYFGLTRIYLKMNDTVKANEVLEQLKELDRKYDYQLISQWYRLAEAMMLMRKLRLGPKIRAQDLLNQIVSEPVLRQRITIIAMKELASFYLMEVQLYGSEEALDDAIQLVNGLYDTAQDQSSFSLLVEVLLLNSKLSLLRGDYSTALLLLDQAELTTSENGLVGLEAQVTMERVALEAETERWKQLSKQNASLKDKIDQSRILEYLLEIGRIVDKY